MKKQLEEIQTASDEELKERYAAAVENLLSSETLYQALHWVTPIILFQNERIRRLEAAINEPK